MPNKIIYNNEQMRGDLQEILRQMNLENYRPDLVVGIARGGLVPATMISHYLKKPLQTINYSLRDNMITHMTEISDVTNRLGEGINVLLVDDICDSGATLRKVVDDMELHMPTVSESNFEGWQDRLKVAVLWNNTAQEVFEPDFVGREINRFEDDRWVIFPYEEWWKI